MVYGKQGRKRKSPIRKIGNNGAVDSPIVIQKENKTSKPARLFMARYNSENVGEPGILPSITANLWRFPRIPKTTFWPFLPFERKYETRRESFVYRLVCLPTKLCDFNVLLGCQSVCQLGKNYSNFHFPRNWIDHIF